MSSALLAVDPGVHTGIKLELVECELHGTSRRFENLLVDGRVIAEREIGTAVWLDVWDDELPDCPRCGRPWALWPCCSPRSGN